MATTIELWAAKVEELALTKKPTSKPNTKTFNGLMISFPSLDKSYQLTTFGYKPGSTKKMSQLMMHYFNEDSVELAKAEFFKILGKGRSGSVGVSCRGYRTGDKRQDFCIQGVVITLLRSKQIRIDIFYRNTELIKKFGADLVFFRDKLIPHFSQLPIESVNFYFANASLNCMFLPLIIPHLPHWKKTFTDLRKRDKKYFEQLNRWSTRYIKGEGDSYRFIKRVQDSLPWVMGDRLYQEFTTFFKEINK